MTKNNAQKTGNPINNITNSNKPTLAEKKELDTKENLDTLSNKEQKTNSELDKLIQKKQTMNLERSSGLTTVNDRLFKGIGGSENNAKEFNSESTKNVNEDNQLISSDTPLFNVKPESNNNLGSLKLEKEEKVQGEIISKEIIKPKEMYAKSPMENRQTFQGGVNESVSIKVPKLPDNLNFADTIASNPDGMKKFVDQFVQHLTTHPNNDIFGNTLGNSLKVKPEEVDKVKRIEEYKDRMENLEREKILLMKKFQEKEKVYIDKINKLESLLHASDKWDIFSLEKQNKEYEIKIINLTKQILYLQEKLNTEKKKNNSFIGELMILKQQLVEEISEIKTFKLNTFKKNFGEKFLDNIINEKGFNSNNALNEAQDGINKVYKKEHDDEKALNNEGLTSSHGFNSATYLNQGGNPSKRVISKPRPNKSVGKNILYIIILI